MRLSRIDTLEAFRPAIYIGQERYRLPVRTSRLEINARRNYPRTSSVARCPTIRSAAFPSHFGGIAPFFHSPAIKRTRSGRGSTAPGILPTCLRLDRR